MALLSPRSSCWPLSRRGLLHRRPISRGISPISVAAAGAAVEHCLCVRRSVSPGETLDHSGTVVVFGNVERGGAVRADGDVIVLGSLEGACQAGRSGKADSIVFSLSRGFSSTIVIANNPNVCVRKSGAGEAFFATKSVKPEPVGFHSYLARSSSPARAAFFTGIYISIAGICFFTFPETLFGLLFSLENVARGWIQATGILGVVFGIYYLGTALGDSLGFRGSSAFYASTVAGRIFLFFSFLWLVSCGACPPPLLIVGAVNLAGALYMLAALRNPNVSAR